MSTKRKIFSSGVLIYLLAACSTRPEVSMQSLLNEMTDRTVLASYPDLEYTQKQFSSYDRASVTADSASWFANWDRSFFVGEEIVDGRTEYIAFEADGPGAITRFWVTVAAYSKKGILRIYIDHDKTPVIEGEVLSLTSGGILCDAPLSESVSKLTDYYQRGHNLYLPIPYAKHCKITYESPSIKEAGINSGENFYYNINYRTYTSPVDVKSFSKDQLAEAKTAVNLANKEMLSYPKESNFTKQERKPTNLKKGAKTSMEIKGSLAIRKLSVSISAADMPQALRSVVLSIAFDGNRTIWAPIGDFYGIGNRMNTCKTFYTEVSSCDNKLSCYWVMPFENDCKITLENVGDVNVLVGTEVFFEDWEWDKKSMYFGSSWHQYTKIHTGEDRRMEGCFDQQDLNFVTLTGKGVYVGDGVTLYNTAAEWWGEGDEKIYVDGEVFPSHFGTGTEDYYGYAWCNGNPFYHPLIAQADGTGATNIGHVSNIRFRSLDAIPFRNKLQMDLELWHWASTIINYAPTSYYYMLPGGKSNILPDARAAALPVVKHKHELISPTIDKNGRIEGERMKVELTVGKEKTQKIHSLQLSNNAQFFWHGAKKNEQAKMIFIAKEAGVFELRGSFVKAGDYGVFDIYLNGKLIQKSLDLYSSELATIKINFGKAKLQKGENILSVKAKGKNEKSSNYLFGLDYLHFEN